MEEITISNDSFYDKEYFKTFVNQEEYKFFAVNTGTSTLVPMYQELLREVIGDDVDTVFQDRALTQGEIEQMQQIFVREIDTLIPNIEYQRQPHQRLEWNGETYDLNLSLVSPNNRQVWDNYAIVKICKECLEENKPMYLSIE